MKIKLTLSTYTVGLEHKHNKDKIDTEEEFYLSPLVNSIDKEKDLLSQEVFEYNSENDNIQLKIQELGEKARKFNSVQLKLAKSLKKLEMKYQIVTK